MTRERGKPIDPLRRVVAEEKGAGSDQLLLDCGHRQVVNHRAAPRKVAKCFGEGCRDWRGVVR